MNTCNKKININNTYEEFIILFSKLLEYDLSFV